MNTNLPTLEVMVLAWQSATIPQRRAALTAIRAEPMAIGQPIFQNEEILTRREAARRTFQLLVRQPAGLLVARLILPLFYPGQSLASLSKIIW